MMDAVPHDFGKSNRQCQELESGLCLINSSKYFTRDCIIQLRCERRGTVGFARFTDE